MLDWAAEQGIHAIRASIAPTNDASRGVLTRFGFHQTGVEWDDVDGQELVFMTTWPPEWSASEAPHVA